MLQRIQPAQRLEGLLRLPGDKSISHRYAMLAAIAEGRTLIRNYSTGADCASTLGCVRALGAAAERAGSEVAIDGCGLDGLKPPSETLDAGNSGSTIRMLSGILAAQSFPSRIAGDESLSRRPMERIMRPLQAMGASIAAREGRYPPLEIGPARLRAIDYTLPVASAQVKTCLLFAGTMTATALRWLMDFNFAEDGDNPVMELPSANRRDITALANVVNILANLGLRIPESWAHAQFDIPQPKELAETDGTLNADQLERILTPSAAVGRKPSGDQPRDASMSSSSSQPSRGEDVSSLTASQAQAALDAIRLRALAEGCDLRALDQLAAPIEALIVHRKDSRDALRELKAAAGSLAPHQLEGVAPQLLILGDLLARHLPDEHTQTNLGGQHV